MFVFSEQEPWTLLRLSGFRTLIAVAEGGGIRAAAQRLGRTPSAVSMTLKKLEDEIGAPLFEGDRKSRPTALGQVTIEKARELLQYYEGTCATITAYARDEVSRCNVAAVTSVAAAILPLAINRVQRDWRNFETMVREINSMSLPDAVSASVVDVAFGRISHARPDIEIVPLLEDSLDLVCHQDHELASQELPIPLSEIARFNFIRNESFGGLLSPELNALVKGARFHTSSVTSVLSLVQCAVGLTILPRLCRTHAPQDLRFLPIKDHTARRVVGMFTKTGRRPSPATERLIASVQGVVKERAVELNYRSLLA